VNTFGDVVTAYATSSTAIVWGLYLLGSVALVCGSLLIEQVRKRGRDHV
jgi:hypothetical protein